MSVIKVNFEVFGKVQGVFFRKFTKSEADKLGVKGWCQNSRDDSVIGEIEGNENQINSMKYWLSTAGSPASRIEKAVFKNETKLNANTFTEFKIRK